MEASQSRSLFLARIRFATLKFTYAFALEGLGIYVSSALILSVKRDWVSRVNDLHQEERPVAKDVSRLVAKERRQHVILHHQIPRSNN